MAVPLALDIALLEAQLLQTAVADHARELLSAAISTMDQLKHGDQARWDAAWRQLPPLHSLERSLDQPVVVAGHASTLHADARSALRQTLLAFTPWRKGPYSVCGISIESEWRSDRKWDRLIPHITPLSGRRVLDVGCGNGYHVFRMVGSGASVVIGIDPALLFYYQFNVLQHFIKVNSAIFLPLGLEQLPGSLACFDTVFSMGVLYHRREPVAHLKELDSALAPGGELVLETLISPDDELIFLEKGTRYARMSNVWAVPSVPTLLGWIAQAGFADSAVVSVDQTTTGEQRTTEWMPYESLQQALDPGDVCRTLEGLPAPLRAIVICRGSKT